MRMPDTTTPRQPVKRRLVYSSMFFALMLLLAAPAILAQESTDTIIGSDDGEFDNGFEDDFDDGELDNGDFDEDFDDRELDGAQQQQYQEEPRDTSKGAVQGGPQGPDVVQQTPHTGGPALLPLAALIAAAGLVVSYWKRR